MRCCPRCHEKIGDAAQECMTCGSQPDKTCGSQSRTVPPPNVTASAGKAKGAGEEVQQPLTGSQHTARVSLRTQMPPICAVCGKRASILRTFVFRDTIWELILWLGMGVLWSLEEKAVIRLPLCRDHEKFRRWWPFDAWLLLSLPGLTLSIAWTLTGSPTQWKATWYFWLTFVAVDLLVLAIVLVNAYRITASRTAAQDVVLSGLNEKFVLALRRNQKREALATTTQLNDLHRAVQVEEEANLDWLGEISVMAPASPVAPRKTDMMNWDAADFADDEPPEDDELPSAPGNRENDDCATAPSLANGLTAATSRDPSNSKQEFADDHPRVLSAREYARLTRNLRIALVGASVCLLAIGWGLVMLRSTKGEYTDALMREHPNPLAVRHQMYPPNAVTSDVAGARYEIYAALAPSLSLGCLLILGACIMYVVRCTHLRNAIPPDHRQIPKKIDTKSLDWVNELG